MRNEVAFHGMHFARRRWAAENTLVTVLLPPSGKPTRTGKSNLHTWLKLESEKTSRVKHIPCHTMAKQKRHTLPRSQVLSSKICRSVAKALGISNREHVVSLTRLQIVGNVTSAAVRWLQESHLTRLSVADPAEKGKSNITRGHEHKAPGWERSSNKQAPTEISHDYRSSFSVKMFWNSTVENYQLNHQQKRENTTKGQWFFPQWSRLLVFTCISNQVETHWFFSFTLWF